MCWVISKIYFITFLIEALGAILVLLAPECILLYFVGFFALLFWNTYLKSINFFALLFSGVLFYLHLQQVKRFDLFTYPCTLTWIIIIHLFIVFCMPFILYYCVKPCSYITLCSCLIFFERLPVLFLSVYLSVS